MFKLLIAEDEIVERKSLKYLINKYYKDKIEIIGEVSDGEKAINQVYKTIPDLIFMDIEMPKINGLEASEIIKNKYSNIEILILTAYSHFEYAKKALQIGVNDYLIKPYDIKEFKHTIDNVILKLEKSSQQKLESNKINCKVSTLKKYLEKNFILDLICKDTLTTLELKEYEENLNINEKYYKCILIKFNVDTKEIEKMVRPLKIKLCFFSKTIIGGSFFKEIIFFIFADSQEKITQDNTILDELSNCFNIYSIKNYNIEISKIFDTFSQIKNSYNNVKTKTFNHINYCNMNSYSYEEESLFIKYLLDENTNMALQVFSKIFEKIRLSYCSSYLEEQKKYLKQLSLIIDRNVLRYFNKKLYLNDINKALSEIENCTTSFELFSYMKNYITELATQISHSKQCYYKKFIDDIKKYIDNNYKENISLQKISEEYNVSFSYLSKIFKQTEGICFKNYLTKIRMEKAIHLINEGNIYITKVCFDVGYSDPNYFSKAFKKYTGISPTSYINSASR